MSVDNIIKLAKLEMEAEDIRTSYHKREVSAEENVKKMDVQRGGGKYYLIKDELILKCPNCLTIMTKVQKNSFEYVNDYFMDIETESADDFLKINQEHRDSINFFYNSVHNRCAICEKDSTSINLSLMKTKGFEIFDYFELISKASKSNNYICSFETRQPWVLTVYDTPYGELHQHFISNFKSDASTCPEHHKLVASVVSEIFPEIYKLCLSNV